MTKIMYEVYDVQADEIIGRITGDQLREIAGLVKHSPEFNQTLVERFNDMKKMMGEPERLRTLHVGNWSRLLPNHGKWNGTHAL